ncbi:hypothetical protein [Azospirillum rugosum]|uniref:Lipoprotein n=1 Tax=Azospirillum rugosum TaxID=416170 RepID=A0ABS4SD53_9PROT|nr:hypothetical protein [Azospirillum rugosum]MBP2290330.1 hypothetical protein [Azospirillum rugosum]MDQ0527806.1 hypothetical protein [Azospirillum rugosum]
MKRAFGFSMLLTATLALGACNQTSNGGLFGDSGGGLFGGSGSSGGGGLFGSGGSNQYARNGQCDDPRYNTSNGGRAEAGTDDYDCSRYGNGVKR